MTPHAYINHEIQDRLRIRIPSRKGNLEYFNHVKDVMSHYKGVDQVKINPVTATVLIFHHENPDSIFNYSKKNHLFKLCRDKTHESNTPLLKGTFEKAETLDAALKKMSQGTWDLKSTFAAGLFGLGILQITKGYYLPPAWSLFKDAFNFMGGNRVNPS